MALIVQKFGGTSVGSTDKIQAVARRVLASHRQGNRMVVVLSAMSGETDRLIGLAQAMQPIPDPREMDMLLATGEQASVALFAMAVKAAGGEAVSLLGDQVAIHTDPMHTRARIDSIDTERIQRHLDQGRIVTIAGFQGVTDHGDITTLGRGGSDTTAVALAAALTADALCDKYYELNKFYFGDGITVDKEIAEEWARIPHFFYNFYVFQYATGFSAAVAIANRILKEGAPAVADYKKFLSGGCSTDPISLLKIAGVDMSSPEPVNSALALFGELVDEMEQLV